MTRAAPRQRTRLSPERRRAEILDAAAQLVIHEGMTSLTMARVAARAGVSKGLVYAYFTNMAALLRAVYERETALLHQQYMDSLDEPHSFEEMVRTTARINRQTHSERQRLVARLASDPLLSDLVAVEEQRNRARIVRFLSREIIRHFGISRPLAEQATRLALGYPPGGRLSPAEETELDEIWGAMMVGAMRELEHRYGNAPANDGRNPGG